MPPSVSNIQKLQAEITADESGLDAHLRSASAKVATFAKKADGHFDRMADAVRGSLKRVGEALDSVGRKMTLSMTTPLLALGTQAVRASVQMDSLKRGLTAVAGSGEEAERQLKRLEEVAKLPGLGFAEAIEGSVRLQAAGIAAQQAERSLMAFGNALATVGKGKAELDGVTLALSQIQSKGKVSAEEINQLAERVPQIRKIMVQAFGTADTEILQKAKITSKDFIKVITDELMKLPKVTGGAQNAFENLSDTVNKTLRTIGDTILPDVLRAIEKLEPALQRFTGWWKGLSDSTKDTYLKIAAIGALAGPTVWALGTMAASVNQLTKAFGALKLAITALANPLNAIATAAVAGVAVLGKAIYDMGQAIEQGNKRAWDSMQQFKKDSPRAFYENQIAEARLRMQGVNPNDSIGKQIIANNQKAIERAQAELNKIPSVAPNAAKSSTATGDSPLLKRLRAQIAAAAGKKDSDKAAKAAKRFAEERREAELEIARDLVEISGDAFERAMFDINRRTEEFRKAGVKEVTIAKWRNAMIEKADREAVNDFLEGIDFTADATRRNAEQIDAFWKSLGIGLYNNQLAQKQAAQDLGDSISEYYAKQREAEEKRIRARSDRLFDANREAMENERKAAEERQRQAEARLAQEDRIAQFSVRMNQMSLEQYRDYLSKRLQGLEQFSESWMRYQEELAQIEQTLWDKKYGEMMRLAQSASQGLADVLVGAFQNGFSTIGADFRQLLRRMAAEYLASQIYNLLMRNFAGLFKDSKKSLPGIAGPISLPGKADGGAVTGGRAYVVGERGPELFVPQRSGSIVPNHQLAAGAGGVTVHIHVSTPDAGSFQRSQGQIMAEAARQLEYHRRRDGR